MAVIVEKYPFIGATGQCLVLDPRERLLYPFDLGNYQEIRMGMYFSFTNVSTSGSQFNTNSNIGSNDIIAPNAIQNQSFIGFCNFNTGYSLPGSTSGYDYIGLYNGNYTSATLAGLNVINDSDSQIYGGGPGNPSFQVSITDTTGFKIALNSAATTNPYLYFPTNSSGASNYAGYWGMRFILSGDGRFSFSNFSNTNTYYSDVSTISLRSKMANLGTSIGTNFTGYFNTGANQNFSSMIKPNSLIIYMPMMNSRMRVHNLIVERYA